MASALPDQSIFPCSRCGGTQWPAEVMLVSHHVPDPLRVNELY